MKFPPALRRRTYRICLVGLLADRFYRRWQLMILQVLSLAQAALPELFPRGS